jgi:uncharacterized protein
MWAASLSGEGSATITQLAILLAPTIGVKVMTNEKQSEGQRGGSGNFANDPQKASEPGKKGGEHSHSRSQQQSGSDSGSQRGTQNEGGASQRGGPGNFANDPQKASEAGKKGGEHSHRGR